MNTKRITPINRSEAEALYPYDYTVQKQAPTGNWVDVMSVSDKRMACEHAQYLQDTHGATVRVIYNLA